MKRTAHKLTALLLAAWLLVGLAQPMAWAATDEITISSAGEFAEFSKNCSLDTWSQGKTFRLTADISLSTVNFTPIPTFGGTFLGGGHTISGLQVDSSGSTLGLFRYVQAGAVIQDLHVSGLVEPDGSRSTVGGIAGVNDGAIRNCSFRGAVKGEASVGGIAGRNDETGEISGCTVAGTVQGLDGTGGITGRNFGLLIKCENNASINTIQQNTSLEIDTLNSSLSQLTSQGGSEDLLVSHSDTGGVAGYSSGVIQSCVNNGDVGYPHVGYNTGGIAGRQTGYLAGCVNNGKILGRKDVGGIAGQAEPYLTLGVSNGTLDRLRRELDTLDGLVQQAIDHTQTSGDGISARLERIGLSTDAARDSSKRLLDHTSDFVDGNVDAVNSLSASVTAALDDLTPALDDLSDASGYMDTLAGRLETTLDTLADSAGLGQDALRAAKDAVEELRQADQDFSKAVQTLKSALKSLQDAVVVKDGAAAQAALEALSNAVKDLGDAVARARSALETLRQILHGAIPGGETDTALAEAVSAAVSALADMENALKRTGEALFKLAVNTELDWEHICGALEQTRGALQSLKDAAGHLSNALSGFCASLGKLETTSGSLRKALEQLGSAASAGSAVSRKLESAFSAMSRAADRLSEDGPLELVPLGREVRDAGDDLYASLSDLSGSLSELRASMDNAGDLLASDLRAVSRQMTKILDLMIDALSDIQGGEKDERELLEDTSDEDISATRQGKITDCRNTGAVEGDRNVGGAVGAMAIEYDLDPEDDTERFSLGSTYETKAVLQNCANRGSVTAKKDCAGGLAGRMDLGTALECQNYGSVTSTSGNYVGGVAGYAGGTIRNSYSKCVLSGASYVGGIAGWASRLRDCAAIITMDEGTEWVGAIAGDADLASGGLRDNFFVDTGTAGVDGISYSGIAEPIDFETLRAMPGIPTDFVSFTLTLMANDAVVASIPFYYGEDLSLVELPKVPEREGSYGAWPEFDTSGLHSDITLEAVYTPWITLIASEAREGTLALALAEGRFTGDAALQVSNSAQTPPAGGSDKQFTDVWELTLSGSDVTAEDTVPIRLLNRGGGRAAVWQLVDGQWHEVESSANGHYLTLTMTGTSGIFCVRSVQDSPLVAILLLAAAVLILLVLSLLIRRGKKKKAAKQAAK